MRSVLQAIIPLFSKKRLFIYTILGVVSGLCKFFFINCVTKIIAFIIAGTYNKINILYIAGFLLLIFAFVWTRKILSLSIIKLSQTLLWDLRMQILALILNTNYKQLSKKRSQIYSAVVNDVNILTEASMNIINFYTSLIVAVACFIFLASISIPLFLATAGVAIIGGIIYHIGSKQNISNFHKARSLENDFLENFNAILDGFKEIYMEPKKGKYIYENKINLISNEAFKNNVSAFTGLLNNQVTGQILFYMLISSILLVFSLKLNITASEVVSFVFTLLYLLSSIETIMVLLPGLIRAKVASTHLMNLKDELSEFCAEHTVVKKKDSYTQFTQISVRDVCYNYENFGIGPINLDIEMGETIFIYGSNGSGKTTFIHCVLGICIPSKGQILLNGSVINREDYEVYRSNFAVVFSDFYLFNELIGIDKFNHDKWEFYIHLFELKGKVTIINNCFSTVNLSTGQRKRLALIAALMEEKPILVIDEWAADQDPYFRKKFYTEIIPLLKKQGLTVIAITHDDMYYHTADKIYKMDYGKLLPVNLENLLTDHVH